MTTMLPISVLDLSFTTTSTPGALALRQTIELAQLADGLGFRRFWVAEHHNLPSVASGAPEIMIGAIAAATSRIRVGSGGVMLPNHAPLMVAERFKVLEGLYPGRIDLGIGRAPGTDPRTSLALRRRQEVRADDDFLERFQELLAWQAGGFPDGHPFRSIRVMPEDVPVPPIWLLGSSDYSAELAGRVGLGFAFAHHFASLDAATAIGRYLETSSRRLADATARHPDRGGDLRGDAGRGGTPGGQQRLWACAPRARRVWAPGQPGSGAGPCLDGGRGGAAARQPCAAVRGRARRRCGTGSPPSRPTSGRTRS